MSQLDGTLLGQPDESDPGKIEIRLLALGEELGHTVNAAARKEISYEYRRLHRRWMELKVA